MDFPFKGHRSLHFRWVFMTLWAVHTSKSAEPSYVSCMHMNMSLYCCAQVVVGDYDELRIPQEAHRIQRSTSEKLDQVD